MPTLIARCQSLRANFFCGEKFPLYGTYSSNPTSRFNSLSTTWNLHLFHPLPHTDGLIDIGSIYSDKCTIQEYWFKRGIRWLLLQRAPSTSATDHLLLPAETHFHLMPLPPHQLNCHTYTYLYTTILLDHSNRQFYFMLYESRVIRERGCP